MKPSMALRLETISDLVRRGFYSMAFQPIRNTGTAEVFGFEALLRGPQGTPLATPGRLFHDRSYLPSPFLHQLDFSCMEAALRTGRLLPASCNLFINMHGETLMQVVHQKEQLFRLLAQLGISPDRIVLEISESTDRAHVRLITKSLKVFRDRGTRVALDDVGTAYPWMHHLLALEPDFLKVDRSLIREIGERPKKQDLLNALLFMADRMGSTLIAEGIETIEEWQAVVALQVPLAQGFWLGRPMAAECWARQAPPDDLPRAGVGAVFPAVTDPGDEGEENPCH